MSAQWYIIRDGDERGPFSAQQLRELAMARAVDPSDMIRSSEWERVVEARNVKGLLDAPTKASSSHRTPRQRDESSTSETVELLADIRDVLNQIADHLSEISGKLENINGTYGIDDVIKEIRDAQEGVENAVNAAAESISSDLSRMETSLIEISVNTSS
jgi:hypothetical protein